MNFADDEELLTLAAKAGCSGVFIGFESPAPEELQGYDGKFPLLKDRDIRASVQRIQRHNILVAGSFIIGLDADEPGIGHRFAETACRYGVDNFNVLFLTPLPGMRLWDPMKSQGRIPLHTLPQAIADLRGQLRSDLDDLPTNSVLQAGLQAMPAACRVFLEENPSPRSGYGPPYEAQLHSTLGELRALFGIHIARIACAYDLEVDAHLEGILPPKSD